MALQISYWSGADRSAQQCYGRLIASEAVSLSGTSAQSGAAPSGARIARLTAGENCRVTNSAASPTASATNGCYLASGESLDVEVAEGDRIAGITA